MCEAPEGPCGQKVPVPFFPPSEITGGHGLAVVAEEQNPEDLGVDRVAQERDGAVTKGRLGAAGVVVVALGYFLLSQGSITLAPLLLVLGYVVLLPLAIIL